MPFLDAGAAGIPVELFRRMKRGLYHKYLALVLELFDEYREVGMWFMVGGKVRHFYPILSLVINDHPEGELLALHKDGSARACRRCITTKDDLHAFDKPMAADRVSKEMQAGVEVFSTRFAASRDTEVPHALRERVDVVKQALKDSPIINSLHLETVRKGEGTKEGEGGGGWEIGFVSHIIFTHPHHSQTQTQNFSWRVDMGVNPGAIYSGAPPDPLHSLCSGLIKYLVIWSLTAVMLSIRQRELPRFVPALLALLDQRTINLPQSSERRIPFVRFNKGLSHLVSSFRNEKNRESMNSSMGGAGGGITSRFFVPAMIQLNQVLVDDVDFRFLSNDPFFSNNDAGEPEEQASPRQTVLTALEMLIDVYFVLKSDALSESQLEKLQKDIDKYVREGGREGGNE